MTGIGHERDSTLADEVAHARFDTPSKVIAGIEQQILRRSREARQAWEAILAAGAQASRTTRLAIERREAQIRADSRTRLARARQDSTAALNAVAVSAVRQVHDASKQSLALLNEVRAAATQEIVTARQQVPAMMASMRIDALASVGAAKAATSVAYNTIIDRSAAATRAAGQAADTRMYRVAERANGAIREARSNAQALMREVTGQGPGKTLARGFAIVRTDDGKPVTSSVPARVSPTLSIQFRDGSIDVRPDQTHGKKRP
ncbi:hypothetical protein J7E70_29525 [Variovorax paradoxus]|nr:exodeoxyribonuclease VII large subunit [Variovorax paradoxus]MBT2304566.1 hypothetical protein [Variovorax paradoxus]